MKPTEIAKDVSYVNKSGRSERRVLDVGAHVKFTWYGNGEAPPGEHGVSYQDTRMGKTFYCRADRDMRIQRTNLSAFSKWACRVVPDAAAAPWRVAVKKG